MAYIKPQVLIHQEFALVPTELTDPLRSFIVGPQAALHRYGLAEEKTTIALGSYVPDGDTEYSWPAKSVGSRIDPGFTKLYLDTALLRYFRDVVGQDSTITPVSNYRNRVRSDSVVWKSSLAADRSALLLDRDVTVGDHVLVRGLDSGSVLRSLTTRVTGFAGEAVAATIGTATGASSNKTAQSYAESVDFVSGPRNTVQVDLDASGYDGRIDGVLEEYYTVEVIQGSSGGDFSTALLRVTSASGLDNVSSVSPEVEHVYFPIGTRGLSLTFQRTESASNSSAAEYEEVSPDDLAVGQTWRVHVQQSFTPATAAADGTYTGLQDTTYLATVTKGGVFGDDPEITLSTTTGYDAAGPLKITAASTAFAIGSYGVTLSFAGTGLRKGDVYYIPVTAIGSGALQTLILAHDLPDSLSTAGDLTVELSLRKNVQVLANRTGFAPDVNWSATQTVFTVFAGMMAYDASWTDGGTLMPLEVVGGDLFLEYREWLRENVGATGSLDDVSGVAGALGPIDPDNPLAFGVFKALANSNGSAVHYTAILNPDVTGDWATALELVKGQEGIYSLVPLTYSRPVQDLFAAHVSGQSTAENGLWRATFVNLLYPRTKQLVGSALSTDNTTVLAKLEDDPQTTGTQYTLVRLTSDNADLVAAGVRAGDTVRFLYTTDGFGGLSFTSFTVAGVLSAQSLVLDTGHTDAISVPQKVEVWRTLTRSEVANELARTAASFGSRRVCAVIPDILPAGGIQVPGYFLCAALAGLRSGSAPHQSLTHVEIQGFDNVQRVSQFFSSSDLDHLAELGTWIVQVDPRSGGVFTRHALTTLPDSLNNREEMIRANVDSISYLFQKRLEPFIGKANVTPSALRVIRTTLESTIGFLKSNGFTQTLGGQLINARISRLSAHGIFKDRIVATIVLTVPAPINNIEVFLVV